MHRPLQIYPALRASVLVRDIPRLQYLLHAHGAAAFAAALSSCSQRVAADVLSLLPMPDRLRVQPHLPTPLRIQVRPLFRRDALRMTEAGAQDHPARCSA